MRSLLALFFLGTLVSGCASAPSVQRARLDGIHDPADGLKRYYEERLTPSADGYVHIGQAYDAYQLPMFYDVQGSTQCAEWARKGRDFKQLGWVSTGVLMAAGAAISVLADNNSPARSAWWMSALPAGLVGWSFHWVGNGWFTKPSVALYNKQLADHLGIGVVPEREEEP